MSRLISNNEEYLELLFRILKHTTTSTAITTVPKSPNI